MKTKNLGAASLKIELRDNTITIYHGTDKYILDQFPANENSWKSIWDGIKKAK